jgi:hypothetical protein
MFIGGVERLTFIIIIIISPLQSTAGHRPLQFLSRLTLLIVNWYTTIDFDYTEARAWVRVDDLSPS